MRKPKPTQPPAAPKRAPATPAEWAGKMFDAIEDGQPAAVSECLAHGADPNAVDPLTEYSPAFMAARRGEAECLRLLLAAGADPNSRSSQWEGMTLAMMAGAWDRADCLRELAAAGADLDALDDNGQTAAILSARNGSEDSVKALHALGADFSAEAQGMPASAHAEESGFPALAAWIASARAASESAAELAASCPMASSAPARLRV